MLQKDKLIKLLRVVGPLIIVVFIVLQLMVQNKTQNRLVALEQNVSSVDTTLSDLQGRFTEQTEIQETKSLQLTDELYKEQQRVEELIEIVDDFEGSVKKLSGSVKTLEKISNTDPELIQKYSQIYFLNEHYMPDDLERIPEKYDFVNGKEVTVLTKIAPFLEDLLDDAWDDGVKLLVLSGYRSFAEQTTLKNDYITRYGSGANTFSADQGYSEHQLGTTVDFTNAVIGEGLQGFDTTNEYAWLQKNAYKYGFVLSYPKGNTYYVYEPWHWRFVGKALARYIDRNNKQFYELEQRFIDGYLASLFDK